MAKRKPSRKTGQKAAGRPVGWVWWTAGLAAVGWLVFDSNRAVFLESVPKLATVIGEAPERRTAAVQPASRVESKSRTDSSRSLEARRMPANHLPVPSLGKAPAVPTVAAVPTVPAVVPSRKPPNSPSDAGSGGSVVTNGRAPLHRSPSLQSPVWTTLEAGRVLRVTGRDGAWRRVEAGIFSGWVQAERVEGRGSALALPVRSVRVQTDDRRPIPPGTVPGVSR